MQSEWESVQPKNAALPAREAAIAVHERVSRDSGVETVLAPELLTGVAEREGTAHLTACVARTNHACAANRSCTKVRRERLSMKYIGEGHAPERGHAEY
jgi:hypothetical protein